MRNKTILFVCNSTASRLWRILPQAKYLQRKGWMIGLKEANKFDFIPDATEIAVLQMVYDERLIRDLKKKNIKIVFELDDLIEWVPKDHYAHKDLKWSNTYYVYKAIRDADAIICTNDYLKKHYRLLRLFKRPIEILPNYVDLEYWKKDYNPNPTDIVRIGYCGGISHVNDLKLIARPLEKILKEFEKIRFVQVAAGGFSTENPLSQFRYGDDCFKNLPKRKREFMIGTPMEIWSTKLNQLQLDIGLASVVDNKFTKCKTPIKWMEYAVNRVPCIASKCLYGKAIEHGKTGFLAETEDDWYKYLKLLIKDKALRERVGERAMWEVYEKYDIKKYLHKWENIFLSLLN